jgi:subtilisin family serine protease
MKVIRTLLLAVILAAPAVAADVETRLRDAGSLGAIRLAGSEDAAASKVYIVQLAAPPAAAVYSAKALRMAGPAPAAIRERPRFDRTVAAVQGYAARLVAEQDRVLAQAGPGAQLVHRYQYSLNGFAARMHPALAHKLEGLPGVLRVWEDEIRPLATTHSLDFLQLFDTGKGLRGPEGLDGEDVIIGFIDSGVAPEHPALSDTREADRPRLCQTDWAENTLLGKWLCRRFDKLEDQLLFEPVENWNGICQGGEEFEDTLCNNKLIGARYFIAGAENSGPIDDGEIQSARDVDGHGTHTATIAAGSRVKASIFDTFIGRVEGVAPRARVAVYKACWLRPGDQRASCNTSDLANAIDAAVADGVDIINYSVGSSMREITAPDDLALLAATKAGVFSVVAAGNEGPNLGTIGSPAGAPWVMTAAASTRNGEASFEAIEVLSPPVVAGKYAMKEANFTPTLAERGSIEGRLVLVDDEEETLEDGGSGTTSDGCEPIANGNDLSNNIALIQRGGCSFDTKLANADDAGAIAAIVYNIAGDPIVMNGAPELSDIPAVMIGQADGNLLLAELDEGSVIDVRMEAGVILTEKEDGNGMATFSARGPGPAPDILKPDVTAPGVNIVAGFTPDAANATPGEYFAYLSGTSMSTPHVAGVAALLLQANPEWAPSDIKSALMTTAHQALTRPEGEPAATPFGYGAGHIVPNDALNPGLVYPVSNDEYDAFACGAPQPVLDDARCNALATDGLSFAGADLNQPSISVARLANEATVQRRVVNVSDQASTYSAQITAPAGIGVSVNPASISLGPGQAATFDVTLRYESGPLDLWRFGSLTWSNNEASVFSPIAVQPVTVTAPSQVTAIGESGSLNFPVEFGYTGAYDPGVHGLRLPLVVAGFVDNDPTKTFTFRSTDGVTIHLIDVPPGEAYLRFALFDTLTDGNDDLDLYIYYCADNINCTRVGESGETTPQEEVNLLLPAGGRYAVLVHGFQTDQVAAGPGANYQLLAWSFGIDDNQGNMTASGPAFVNAGTTADVTVNWSGLLSDTIYLGGISHNTPQGLSAITVIRIGN